MKTVLVAGGSGLLGSQVAKVFQEAGWAVRAPSHVEADLTDPKAVEGLVAEGPDLIVNCAAQRRPDLCEGAGPALLELNVRLPERLRFMVFKDLLKRFAVGINDGVSLRSCLLHGCGLQVCDLFFQSQEEFLPSFNFW